ncbi:hypothetical protein [Stigmatella aurantiaca]|uniref:Conserved uncharacterized protein n=1 Tax=Stigmatella aurantiaca (strain DW4/3-1) TaxID=378806 RepID=Q09B39_STIAD|nr:hypothetical protein [Stigmatella aurantiaca]ADO69204.1 conserved uncharacterized protein [Stigmatella aurantiaca DW4/3-1]EAU68954.1 hypothetical protein STIAU_0339 [Stigmatella aurantiaca DW4/3-1]
MKSNGMQWSAWVLVAGLIFTVEASAQEVRRSGGGRFGSTGEIVLSSDLSGAIGYRSAGDGQFFISLRPAGDYFLKENLSLGGYLTLATVFQEGPNQVEVGLGVRGGYNIWLNETVSVWPRLGLGLNHQDYGFGDRTFLAISLDAPFLVHLTSSFFIGAGPGLITELGDDTSATLQVSTLLGGHF